MQEGFSSSLILTPKVSSNLILLVVASIYQLMLCVLQGHVYAEATDFHCSERGWLAYARGLLLYKCLDSVGTSTLTVINPENLQEQQTYNLEGNKSFCIVVVILNGVIP